MNSEKTPSLTKMDKIRIVVEYSELSGDEQAGYLKKNGIDQEQLRAYQREAAAIIGGAIGFRGCLPLATNKKNRFLHLVLI